MEPFSKGKCIYFCHDNRGGMRVIQPQSVKNRAHLRDIISHAGPQVRAVVVGLAVAQLDVVGPRDQFSPQVDVTVGRGEIFQRIKRHDPPVVRHNQPAPVGIFGGGFGVRQTGELFKGMEIPGRRNTCRGMANKISIRKNEVLGEKKSLTELLMDALLTRLHNVAHLAAGARSKYCPRSRSTQRSSDSARRDISLHWSGPASVWRQ